MTLTRRSNCGVGISRGLSGIRCEWGSRHPDLDFVVLTLRQAQVTETFGSAEKDRNPLVVAEEPVGNLACSADDLTGQRQPLLQELLELHGQQGVPIILAWLQQGHPRLDAPRQGPYHHVRPVSQK